MKEDDKKLVLYAGAGVAAYLFVFKPILKSFGVDPASQAAVAAVETLPPSQNPFNMAYSKGSVATGAVQFPGFFTDLKKTYDANPDSDDIDDRWRAIAALSEQIYNAFQGFNTMFLGGDVESVNGSFGLLGDKKSVSDIDAFFEANYGKSLFPYLRDGEEYLPLMTWFNDGLSVTNLAKIIGIVNSLPDSLQNGIAESENRDY